ncbi:MAG TPA: CAP domain-containing protein [Steroidobacteraceae bacterium]|nr:CAP domain-containing protein [Steroidobacteraceae bacterium]
MLLLGAPPALASAVSAVNRARTVSCGLAPAPRPPLAESRRLDEVARLLARGEPLEQAQIRAGYRAARSLWIQITGATGDAAVERIVSRQFCGPLADARLRRIGAYRDGASSLWVVVAQPFTTPRAQDATAVSRLVLALTNEARAHARTCGGRRFPPAPPLSLSPALTRAARAHSRDMAAQDFFSHSGSNGSTPGERVTRAGYRWSMVGENIASGERTPRQAVAGWLASPHHCANIMTAGFRQMGVAFAVNRANTRIIDWTEDFGRPFSRPRPPRHAAGRGR